MTGWEYRKRVLTAKITMWMANRAMRNKSALDRYFRGMIEKGMALPPENDFMKDDLIDNDQGYDPEELARYQRGETG